MPALASAPSTPDACAAAWFSAMLLAASRGDYQEAAAAQRELRNLGWRIDRIKPQPETPRGEAPRG